jgi:hypothetical protein
MNDAAQLRDDLRTLLFGRLSVPSSGMLKLTIVTKAHDA